MYHKTRPHYPITKLVRKKGQTVAICFANGWTSTSALKRRCTFRAGSAPPGRSKRRGSAHKGLTVSPCWPRCQAKMPFNLAKTTYEVQANCSQEKSIICIYIYNTVYINIIYLIISGQSMLWYITGLMDHHFWAKLDDWIVGPTTECRSLSSCPNIAATWQQRLGTSFQGSVQRGKHSSWWHFLLQLRRLWLCLL